MVNYQDKKDSEMKKELRLIKMSSVEVEEIQWIWYPYIPCGKVTIIQGDPGEGKTTFVLAMIALLTKGEALPEEETAAEQEICIYDRDIGLMDEPGEHLETQGYEPTEAAPDWENEAADSRSPAAAIDTDPAA